MVKFFLLSIASGILSGLSLNFSPLSFLCWVSFIPLFYALKKSSFKQSLILSYSAGLVHFLTVIFWIGFVTRLGLVLLLIYLSLYWLLFGLLSKAFFLKRGRLPVSLAFLWVVLEYARSSLGGFGWGLLGYSQYKNLWLIQPAAITGVWGISFLIVYANIVLFNLFTLLDDKHLTGLARPKRKPVFLQALVFVFLTTLSLVYSSFVLRKDYSKEAKLSLTIIQPDIPQGEKWTQGYSLINREKLFKLSRQAPLDSLLIFPEASWPEVITGLNRRELEIFFRRIGRDGLIGSVIEEKGVFYNTALLADKDLGATCIYRKVKLVPFGEYVPFRKYLPFIDVLNSLGDINPGKEYTVFSYKKARISSLICFEDIFPDFVKEFVKRGANLLVNITNDAWFRGYPEASQHLQSAVFRAVENRRFLVRVANTGISCIISPQGKISGKISVGNKDVFVKGVQSSEVPLVNNRSIFSRINSGLVFLIIILVLLGRWVFTRQGKY